MTCDLLKKAEVTVISQRYAHAVHLTEMRKRDFFLARKRSDLEREEQELGSRAFKEARLDF